MLVGKPEREPAIVNNYIHSGRARLRCDIAGAGPLLVFLHAGVADRRSWSAIMSELADTHRSVAYDRRGFGETTCEPEPFAHVDDLLAVVNALGAERVQHGTHITLEGCAHLPQLEQPQTFLDELRMFLC